MMKGSDDSALQQSPERINRLGVDFTANVLLVLVNYRLMAIFRLSEIAVITRFVSGDKADFTGYSCPYEIIIGVPVKFFDNLANDITLAADGTEDFHLSSCAAIARITFAQMLVSPLCRL